MTFLPLLVVNVLLLAFVAHVLVRFGGTEQKRLVPARVRSGRRETGIRR